jgi:hypothetical protein
MPHMRVFVGPHTRLVFRLAASGASAQGMGTVKSVAQIPLSGGPCWASGSSAGLSSPSNGSRRRRAPRCPRPVVSFDDQAKPDVGHAVPEP